MENIINKKGFKVGDKVKVKRKATEGDYRWMRKCQEAYKRYSHFSYDVGKPYRIAKILSLGAELDNCAVFPNHLLIKV